MLPWTLRALPVATSSVPDVVSSPFWTNRSPVVRAMVPSLPRTPEAPASRFERPVTVMEPAFVRGPTIVPPSTTDPRLFVPAPAVRMPVTSSTPAEPTLAEPASVTSNPLVATVCVPVAAPTVRLETPTIWSTVTV